MIPIRQTVNYLVILQIFPTLHSCLILRDTHIQIKILLVNTYHLPDLTHFQHFTAQMDSGKFAEDCKCPVACEYDDITMKLSYSEFGSVTSVDEMNMKYFNRTNNGSANILDRNFYRLIIYLQYNSTKTYKSIFMFCYDSSS